MPLKVDSLFFFFSLSPCLPFFLYLCCHRPYLFSGSGGRKVRQHSSARGGGICWVWDDLGRVGGGRAGHTHLGRVVLQGWKLCATRILPQTQSPNAEELPELCESHKAAVKRDNFEWGYDREGRLCIGYGFLWCVIFPTWTSYLYLLKDLTVLIMDSGPEAECSPMEPFYVLLQRGRASSGLAPTTIWGLIQIREQ